MPFFGLHVAELIERQRTYYIRFTIAAFLWPVLLTFANTSTWAQNTLGTFAGNVLASLTAAALWVLAPRALKALG